MKVLLILVLLIVVSVSISILMKSRSTSHLSKSEWPPQLVEKFQREKAAREKIRNEDPEFFDAVSAAMFRRDPMGINFENNVDEYEAEAGTVIPRLSGCASAAEVANVLHQEFTKWFGPEISGEKNKYSDLANDIWALWEKKLGSKTN